MRNKLVSGMENGLPNGSLTKPSAEKDARVANENEPPVRASSAGSAARKVKVRELLKCSSAGVVRPSSVDKGFKVPNGLQGSVLHSPIDDVIKYSNKKRLVLHFDVRNTILVHDSVTNINVEQSLNSFLTGVVWGTEVEGTSGGEGGEVGGWEWKSTQPSLQAPSPDCITYYKYMEKQLVKTPRDRAMLRRVTGDFTQQDIGKQFNPYFKKHLELLKWNHEQEDKKLTMEGEDGSLYHYILPSFFKLLNFLHSTGREHSIIIRTYGLDAPNVLRAIEHTLRGNHPGFPCSIPHDVNIVPGKVSRSETGEFKCEVINNPNQDLSTATRFQGHPPKRRSSEVRRSSSVCTATSDIYLKESEIYDMFSAVEGVCGFVDDFKFWQDHEYQHTSGKPLWIDLSDPSIQHVIFDDNIRVTDEDSIVDVRVLEKTAEGGANAEWTSLEKDQIQKLEDICLVQADLLQSTENEDYFIEKLLACEKNYDRLLSEGL